MSEPVNLLLSIAKGAEGADAVDDNGIDDDDDDNWGFGIERGFG